MEKNQKVIFQINPELGFMEDGYDEGHKERVGLFQEFGLQIVQTENGSQQESIVIIQDLESGRLYQVNPDYVTVCNE
ncbi:MAG: hypothetical protein IKV26_03295 [Paludibacteraceae bacterium]|nr:hypothetical protein [Paludibacteraceae bacterium]